MVQAETVSTLLHMYVRYAVVPSKAVLSRVASMGRSRPKKVGIQSRLSPSWIVYRVAPCLVNATVSGLNELIPVDQAL